MKLHQYKLYRKLVLWFMKTQPYQFFVLKIIPYIRFSVYYTSFRGWKYHKGYELLQPGDIVLSVDTKKGSSAIISKVTADDGGKDSSRALVHAGQCIAKNGFFEIAEMTHRNYTRSCFYDFCKEAERVVIIRCTDYDTEYINKTIIPNTLSAEFQRAKYNAAFDWYSTDLYCSSLCYRADSEKRMKIDIEDLIGLGMPYISPEGLYDMHNKIVVWDSDDEKTPEGMP